MMKDYKKITILVEPNCAEQMKSLADKQYLTVSAYIRKAIDSLLAEELRKEVEVNGNNK